MKNERPVDRPKVVLASVDSTTLCIKCEASFVVDDLQELLRILALEALEEIKNSSHTISVTQLNQLRNKFDFAFNAEKNDEITVRCWHWLDELPYKCHTGRELTMMLDGKKPLSFFNVFTSEGLENEAFAEAAFDAHVEKGTFTKHQKFIRDDHSPVGAITVRYVFYALKGEEWRIKAFLFLLDITRTVQWNDSFERIVGALLGYSGVENDAYLALKNSDSGQRVR